MDVVESSDHSLIEKTKAHSASPTRGLTQTRRSSFVDLKDHFQKKAAFKAYEKACSTNDAELLRTVLKTPHRRRWIEDETLGDLLHQSILRSNEDFVAVLLDEEAPLNALNPRLSRRSRSAGQPCDTVLHSALRFGNERIRNLVVAVILRNNAQSINAPGIGNETALHISISVGDIEITKKLIANGALVDEQTIRYVAKSRSLTVLDIVLDKLDQLDISHETAYLVERCNRVFESRRWAYERAASALRLLDLGLLLPNENSLQMALKVNSAVLVKEILSRGAPANGYVNSKHARMPILIFAVLRCGPQVVEALLQHGANVEARDEKGQTALHAAVGQLCGINARKKTNPGETAPILLKHGADVDARDYRGKTPFARYAHRLRPELIYQLALNCSDNKKWESAKEMLQFALQRYQFAFGAGNMRTINVYFSLAEVYQRADEKEKALEIFLQVLERCEKSLGVGDTKTIKTLVAIAQIYLDQNEFRKAEEIRLLAFERAKFWLGEGHLLTWLALFNVGQTHVVMGRPTEAEDCFLRVLATMQETLTPHDEWILRTYFWLGKTYELQGRKHDAEKVYARALAGCDENAQFHWSDDDAQSRLLTVRIVMKLSELYRSSGRNGEAESLEARLRTDEYLVAINEVMDYYRTEEITGQVWRYEASADGDRSATPEEDIVLSPPEPAETMNWRESRGSSMPPRRDKGKLPLRVNSFNSIK